MFRRIGIEEEIGLLRYLKKSKSKWS